MARQVSEDYYRGFDAGAAAQKNYDDADILRDHWCWYAAAAMVAILEGGEDPWNKCVTGACELADLMLAEERKRFGKEKDNGS